MFAFLARLAASSLLRLIILPYGTTLRACSKSAMMSEMFSIPTDTCSQIINPTNFVGESKMAR